MGVDFELIRKAKLDVSRHVGKCPRCKNYVNLSTTERLEDRKYIGGRLSHKVCNICQVIIKQEVDAEFTAMKDKAFAKGVDMRIEFIPEHKPELSRYNTTISQARQGYDLEREVLDNPSMVLDIICRHKGANWVVGQIEPLMENSMKYRILRFEIVESPAT